MAWGCISLTSNYHFQIGGEVELVFPSLGYLLALNYFLAKVTPEIAGPTEADGEVGGGFSKRFSVAP